MNKGYLKLVATAVLLQAVQGAHGQMTESAPDVSMIPGTTTGMNLDRTYSPDLFSGTANINIPIYHFSRDNVDYGISLGYNTKGVKVDMPASPVGLNWDINAGATITRIVKDIPDEIQIYSDSVLDPSHPIANQERYLEGKLFTYTETAQQKTTPNVYRDGESDEFRVSMGNSSFSFYLGKDNQYVTIPHRNVKIELFFGGLPLSWTVGQVLPEMGVPSQPKKLSFRITDEKGNTYYFISGDSEDDEIGKFSDWQQEGFTVFTNPILNWVVQKVVLADGNEIDYEYQVRINGISFQGYPYNEYQNFFVKESTASTPPTMGFDGAPFSSPEGAYSQLTEIKYPNGVTADLIYGQDASRVNEYNDRMLDEIRISSGGNCVRYNLDQEKINSRWFLKKITMASCDSTKEEPYFSFGYNPLPLPQRMNGAQDLFGYYNGNSTGTAIGGSGPNITIPKHHAELPAATNYGSDRSYNAVFAQAGLLDTMRNAYGGELCFTYGANTALNYQFNFYPFNDPSYIGTNAEDGVRLQSITEMDKYHPGNTKLTSFTYSGGQLFTRGGFFDYPQYVDSLSGQWKTQIFQSMFLTHHQLIHGSNHGYSNVSIKTYADGALLSRRDVTFTNADDASRFYKIGKYFYEYPYTDKQYLKDWEIGLPLTMTDYDQNNRIKQKTTNYYGFSDVDLSASAYISNTKTLEVNSGQQQHFPGMQINTDWYPYKKTFTDTYYPFTGTALLDSTVTLNYVTDSRFIADTIWYSYDDHNNLTSTITKDSKGEKTAMDLVYNYDVDGPNNMSGNTQPGTPLYNMTDSGLEKVVSTEHWLLFPPTPINPGQPLLMQNNNQLLSADISQFHYQDGKLWLQGLLSTKTGNPINYSDYTGVFSNGPLTNPYYKILAANNTTNHVPYFERTNEVAQFDVNGNPVEIKTMEKNQYEATVWDINTNQKLAEASNCRYEDLGYSGFEELYNPIPYDTTVIRGNFIFDKGYIVSIAGLNGYGANHCFNLRPGYGFNGTKADIVGVQMLTAGKAYRLSFWAKEGAPALKVGTTTIPVTTGEIVYSVGGWSNYQFEFTPTVAGKIEFSASGSTGSYIDEIRLCPVDAQMLSWTYVPLFGLSSSTDPAGRITWYEQDKFGRQSIVRDQEGNIISKTTFTIGQ